MKILGFHAQDDLIACSDGTCTRDNYTDFLLRPRQDCILVCYNLDWFVALLVRLMGVPDEQIKKFWTTSKLFYQGHSAFFVPHRYFSLKYGKHFGEASFSDIYQYDNTLPFDVDPLDAAKTAAEIGQRVYDVLARLNLRPTSLSSPIAAYQKEILSTLDLPTYHDMPSEVSVYAHRCQHGGWQEAYKIGHFQAWDYDITSAFTFHTANLIDTRRGKWEKGTGFYPPEVAPYGFCRGIAQVDSDFNSCIYTHGNADCTPTGERPDFKTNAAIQNMRDSKEGEFIVKDGWYWLPEKIEYPLQAHIERLFEWKQYLKGFEREIIKRLLVGLTGKLSETFKSETQPFGRLANFAWYSWVQDQTKLQVADLVRSNHAEDALLSIEVDGCKFSRELPIKLSGNMGDWRLNMSAPTFVISSGVGCIKGKELRGTFSLDYDWLQGQITANPEAPEYTMQKSTPITIGYAIKFKKLDRLGQLEKTERSIMLNDTKRLWPELPRRGADLLNQYDSIALDMSMLQAQSFTERDTDAA